MKIAFSFIKSEITFNKLEIHFHNSKETAILLQAVRNIWLEYFEFPHESQLLTVKLQ